MTADDDLVWYVAYGSNMDPDRFAHYLEGGRPAGARRAMRGARDRAAPRDRRPVLLPRRLFFAGESTVWGGGMAFLDHRIDAAATTPAVAHLVTAAQFDDVLAQENRRPPRPTPLHDLPVGGVLAVGPGRYETLVDCPAVDGRRAVTFAGPEPLADTPPAPPSSAYLATMAAGLRSVVGLDDGALADHLLDAPGVSPTWTRETLLAAVAQPRVP
jgi:hypothetical protein